MAVDGVENSNRSRSDPDEVWRSFREIVDLASEIFSTVTQLGFVLRLSRSDYGGPIFGALCISEPLLNLIGDRGLWSKGQYLSYYMGLTENQCLLLGGSAYIVYSDNVHYLRMRALHDLSTEKYRHDIISGNLADYITKGGY